MVLKRLIFFALIFDWLVSCAPGTDHTAGFSYDLAQPLHEFELPNSLREISGITFYSGNSLGCIQDEKGKIYLYNLDSQEVQMRVEFAPDHDYEGVALVQDTFYVLHSNGTLFQVIGFATDSQQTRKYDTFLRKENNTEGLCYDNTTHCLLIACKGVSHKKEKEDVKEIYRFSLDTWTLGKKAEYKIKLEDLEKFMLDHHLEVHGSGDSFFEPSEIAVHPVTHEIYVLSSMGKLIVVLDRNGNLKEVASIPPVVAAHPEGMTFSPSGNLFISSEGKGSKKVILEFGVKT